MKVRTLLVGAGVIALVAGGCGLREYRIEAARCDAVDALQKRLPVAPEATIKVVGDSYAAGWGLDSYAEAWPSLLGTPVSVTAHPGAGWDRAGSCDGPTITEATAAGAPGKTLIVQAGLNDTLQSFTDDTIAEAVAALDGVAARLVVVGPPDAPGFTDEQKVDAAMQLGIMDLNLSHTPVTYVSLLDLDLPMQEDGQHPSAEGHALIAERVAAALR